MSQQQDYQDQNNEKKVSPAQTEELPAPGPPLTERSDPALARLLRDAHKVLDRLILSSFPALILCLILWAVSAAFPGTGKVLNLIVNVIIILVTCICLMRIVETAWRWAEISSDETLTSDVQNAYMAGTVVSGFAALTVIGLLVGAILNAASISGALITLMIVELAFLVLEYWRIVRQHLSPNP